MESNIYIQEVIKAGYLANRKDSKEGDYILNIAFELNVSRSTALTLVKIFNHPIFYYFLFTSESKFLELSYEIISYIVEVNFIDPSKAMEDLNIYLEVYENTPKMDVIILQCKSILATQKETLCSNKGEYNSKVCSASFYIPNSGEIGRWRIDLEK